jgi:hypothetical protein
VNALVRLRRQQMREHEVMDALRRSRWVSVFWLQEPLTRWAALNRMEKRGEISVKVMGYPMYRVTIRKPNAPLERLARSDNTLGGVVGK